MNAEPVNIRKATPSDLEDINRVIEAAIMSWMLPERVKRLSLPSYRYNRLDFDHLDMVVAEHTDGGIVGVAAWEQAEARDTPPTHQGLLLHGLFVSPEFQHKGIGRCLFHRAERAVRDHRLHGLLVKAQEDASGFFLAQGMHRLPVEDAGRDYAHRFWKSTAPP
jgi:N-acetylglutamate synthase-like GNAT family acetyltransferase